jgi:hypothetical protein
MPFAAARIPRDAVLRFVCDAPTKRGRCRRTIGWVVDEAALVVPYYRGADGEAWPLSLRQSAPSRRVPITCPSHGQLVLSVADIHAELTQARRCRTRDVRLEPA